MGSFFSLKILTNDGILFLRMSAFVYKMKIYIQIVKNLKQMVNINIWKFRMINKLK